eukprot:gene9987-10142_t
MSHKIDLGFHRHAIIVTSPKSCESSNTCAGAGRFGAPVAPFLPAGDEGMYLASFRGGVKGSEVTIRCLPSDEKGLLDLSGVSPQDAVVGDADVEPRADRFQDSSLAAAVMGGKTSAGKAESAGRGSLPQALTASIPSGPLAEDAAMCDPPLWSGSSEAGQDVAQDSVSNKTPDQSSNRL